MFFRRTMNHRSKMKSRGAVSLALAAMLTSQATTADACCLTNWLYGRPAPYAVGTAPYVAGYAPTAIPVAQTPGVLATPTRSAYSLPIATPVNPQAYALQRPAYLDNPSVYTGRPVLPTTGIPTPVLAYRGATTTSNPIYGTGNQYPTNFQARTSYQVPLTPSVNSGAAGVMPVPPSALPATPVAPVFAPTPPRPAGGLARFFNSLFGRNYRTSYYAAPVTYYRPATTIDPITGTTVTVQQPCTSYAQQIQRTPYAGVQVAPSTISPSTFGSTGSGSVGQVGGYSDPMQSGSGVTTIPSTAGAMPLTGPPSSFSGGATGDFAPVVPPSLPGPQSAGRIDLNTPSSNGLADSGLTSPGGDARYQSQSPMTQPREPSTQALPSDGIPADGQWRLKSSSDPDASRQLDSARYAPSALPPARGTAVRPIPAPSDYRSEARRDTVNAPSTSTVTAPPLRSTNQAPAPPSGSFTSKPMRGETSREQRVSVPVREASMESGYRASRYPVRATPAPTTQTRRNNKWRSAD